MTKYFTKEGDEFQEVEAQLFTQDALDGIVETRLERQRKQFADYDDLKEKAAKVDTVASEFETKLQDATTAKTELEQKLQKQVLETERVKIIHKFNVPEDLHEFVIGETADDMAKRAEKLSKQMGGKINIDKGEKPDEKVTDTKKMARDLLGRGKSDD